MKIIDNTEHKTMGPSQNRGTGETVINIYIYKVINVLRNLKKKQLFF